MTKRWPGRDGGPPSFNGEARLTAGAREQTLQNLVFVPMAESVWDYPRPPRLEPTDRLVRVELGGRVVAETRSALRVLETSHPPTYYIPLEDINASLLEPSGGRTSFCEWKGNATYFDVVVGERRAERAAWTYPDPTPSFQQLRGYVAFYVDR